MAPKFGTSGLRGLVTELDDATVAAHVAAFLAACPHGGGLHVGQDLRPSSPRIAAAVIGAARAAGVTAVDCGVLPTPALALAAMARGQAALMVTGSHIPADRNGLKFYVPSGEIGKADETAILAALDQPAPPAAIPGGLRRDDTAAARYGARYVAAFGPQALEGMRIGVYQHSTTLRDLLPEVLAALGAQAVPLGRAAGFVPVDTEAVEPATRAALKDWAAAGQLDAIVSADGDADRPLLTDATGRVVPGDVLGALTARWLGARAVVTPVSSNTLVDSMPERFTVTRTRIGSPYVIAAMTAVLAADPAARVVGYEANGGFLLGFAATGPGGAGGDGPLAPLMTRDSLLPLLAPLAAARVAGGVARLVAGLPLRFTAADRLTGVDAAAGGALIDRLAADPAARAVFFDTGAPETAVDRTDGLRLQFANGDIVHLRPSGNAPEFRCYAESASADRAEDLLRRHLARIAATLQA